MRRMPNPWIAVPAILLGLLAGGLAWVVAGVGCDVDNPLNACVGWSLFWGVIAFAAVTVGTAIVLVLVYRSIAEWREASAKGEEPPGPGCEI